MEHKHLMELWFFLGVALEILVTAEIWNSKQAPWAALGNL
ncbi:hypothetical protein PspLS_08041 [Pyricularia sp. CBS 133598]|nr:hypothetical protein PspLS_08041 [Pyricularia sp. CBS 133598]